jgi:hypothetical protein
VGAQALKGIRQAEELYRLAIFRRCQPKGGEIPRMVKMLVSEDHSPDVALLFQGEAATQGASVQGQVAVDKERGEAGALALNLMGAKDTQVHTERVRQRAAS